MHLAWAYGALQMTESEQQNHTLVSTFKTDAFMCGYLLWEIHTGGCHPWSGVSATEAARLVIEGKRPSYERISNERVRDLVAQCWKAGCCAGAPPPTVEAPHAHPR